MVVRLRWEVMVGAYLLVLVVLACIGWVGLQERMVIASFPCSETCGIAVGEVDSSQPNSELLLLTPREALSIGGLSRHPRVEVAYNHSNWRTDPLVALAVGDFDPEYKPCEVILATSRGWLILLRRDPQLGWSAETIAHLPWPSPTWTTHALTWGQLDPSTPAEELALVGDYFDWDSKEHTGLAFLIHTLPNGSWQVTSIYTEEEPLLCAATSEINTSRPGLELLVAGSKGIVSLLQPSPSGDGSWQATPLHDWAGAIPSLTTGDLIPEYPGYEIAITVDGQIFTLHREGERWIPKQIWRSDQALAAAQTLIGCDLDPNHAGWELLAWSITLPSFPTGAGIHLLHLLAWGPAGWYSRTLQSFSQPPAVMTAADLDISRPVHEVAVATASTSGQLTILALPSTADRATRTLRATILPALLLLPGTAVLFAISDYLIRVAEQRRRTHALQMLSRGYVRCPRCRRFLPRHLLDAHLRAHEIIPTTRPSRRKPRPPSLQPETRREEEPTPKRPSQEKTEERKEGEEIHHEEGAGG